jgi:hypothetical protein
LKAKQLDLVTISAEHIWVPMVGGTIVDSSSGVPAISNTFSDQIVLIARSPRDPRLDLDHEPRATAMLSCVRSVPNGD